VPKGRDLQLWSLPDGATVPASLGVLPADGKQVQASPAAGGQLLVSLEPAGGSPTGAPTGPVVYSGRLITE
jgi:anti-sigma-K factor RskA